VRPYCSAVRLGLISDLHGNLLALEAVIEDLETAGIDRLVCLGDVAAGPEPRGTIERLRELGCPVVVGNWDCWLLEGMPQLPGDAGPKLRDQGDWSAAQLGEPEQAFLKALPPHVNLNLDGAAVLCVHGSPRSTTDDIQATTPDEELANMLAGSEPAFLAAGHTHVQLARQHGSTLIVNPGSVGLPFNSWPPNGEVRVSPWAEYAILTIDDGLISTELRRVSYDISALLDVARESGMPHSEWWAGQWVTAAQT
jgi:putative phosphoesterase